MKGMKRSNFYLIKRTPPLKEGWNPITRVSLHSCRLTRRKMAWFFGSISTKKGSEKGKQIEWQLVRGDDRLWCNFFLLVSGLCLLFLVLVISGRERTFSIEEKLLAWNWGLKYKSRPWRAQETGRWWFSPTPWWPLDCSLPGSFRWGKYSLPFSFQNVLEYM